MTWQTAIFLHLIFSAGFALVQRSVSRQFTTHAKVAVAFIYGLFVTPLGVAYGLLNYDISFNFSLLTWIFLFIAGVIFALANITAYRSNAHIDAAQFAILTNLIAVFTVIIAAIFLSERMTLTQLLGVAILVSAAGLVSVRKTTKRTFQISSWSILAILSALFAAMGLTFEKHLLGQMNVGTYMIIGWGFQTLAMVVLAAKEWHTLKDFNKRGIAKLSSLGVLRFLQGVTFVTATSQANIGLLTSIVSYKSVLIFAGGIIILREKNHIIIRLFGSVLATIGLFLVFS
jgi:transporter family protein